MRSDYEARLGNFASVAKGRRHPFEWIASSERARLDPSDDLAVRDVLARYASLLDAGDLEGLMRIFDAEAILVNPRGTFAGTEALRANFAWLMRQRRLVFHTTSNVLVRGSAGEAWLTAYYQIVSVNPLDEMRLSGGTYVLQLVPGDGWVITAMRITDDYLQVLRPGSSLRPAAEPPPDPTQPLTSSDWCEDPFA